MANDTEMFLRGYDCAVEEIMSLKANLDVYSAESLMMHFLDVNEDKAEEVFDCIRDWMDMGRSQIITSIEEEVENNVE